MNIRDKIKDCYGCGACKNICPYDAINISENESGFLNAIIDYEKCKDCGVCLKVCPRINNKFENDNNPKCIAAWAKDEIREKCASGGIFSAIALDFIEKGGWIAGAVWAEDYHAEFIITNTIEGLQRICNSKYVQADIKGAYKEIEEKLKIGKEVLFCGCPCQVAGLKSYLQNEYSNLFTIDLVCHGVPSQKILKKYLMDTYEYENIEKVDFRDKSYFGWSTEMNVYFKDNTVCRKRTSQDAYYQAFLRNMSLNPNCETCQFSKLPRQGDITIGDFWQIEKYARRLNDGKGTSLVLLNNEKGKILFDSCKNIVLKEEVPFEFIRKTCNSTVFSPFRHHYGSRRFLKEFDRYEFSKSVNECLNFHYDIGLITTWFARNYGAIFTAYALYIKLQEMGYSVLMLNKPIELWGEKYFSNNRNPIALEFGRRYYNVSKQYSIHRGAELGLELLNNHCDIFMTGSDQLWNPKIYAKMFYFFMDFVDEKHKKIAYATSIGSETFQGTPEEKYKIEYLLERFDKISVREQEAVNVCKKELNVNASRVLDPVFLLDKEQYVRLAKEKKEEREEFIFAYILDGNIAKGNIITKIKEKYNLPVVCAYDIEHPESSKKYLNIPEANIKKPEDWLWYIQNSKLVVTDSYHGACFSIIFNKEFICFGNKLRGINRFKELFSKLGIRNRLIELLEGDTNIDLSVLSKRINYDKVNFILSVERKKSLIWLNFALQKSKGKKMTQCDFIYEKLSERIDVLQQKYIKKSSISMVSSIGQLGLKECCYVQDILDRLEENTYFQQVQGKIGEPLLGIPAGYGVLTIKKTTKYFIEVMFIETVNISQPAVIWIATVVDGKIRNWTKMISEGEVNKILSNLINEVNVLKEDISRIEKNIEIKK